MLIRRVDDLIETPDSNPTSAGRCNFSIAIRAGVLWHAFELTHPNPSRSVCRVAHWPTYLSSGL